MRQHEIGASPEQRLASDLQTFSFADIDPVSWADRSAPAGKVVCGCGREMADRPTSTRGAPLAETSRCAEPWMCPARPGCCGPAMGSSARQEC